LRRLRDPLPFGRRIPLESNDDGTFSGTFRTDAGPGVRHLVVDVLSHGSLYDSEEAYDNVAWGIPYVLGVDVGVDTAAGSETGESDAS
jgi:hypothetical protein